MKTCGIYKITNIDTDKVYIGQSSNIEKRWNTHIKRLNNNTHINKHLQAAWNKYGADRFKFTVFMEVEESKLDEWEVFLIKAIDLQNPDYGYNKLPGGSRSKLDIEARKTISQTHKGKIISVEQRQKISIANKGKKRGIRSTEHRQRISLAKKGIRTTILSTEAYKKIAEMKKGKERTTETRQKVTEGLKRYWKNKKSK